MFTNMLRCCLLIVAKCNPSPSTLQVGPLEAYKIWLFQPESKTIIVTISTHFHLGVFFAF